MTNIGHFQAAGSCLMPMGASRRRDCGSRPRRAWTPRNSRKKDIILYSARPARAWRCPGVPCAWATRLASRTPRRSCLHQLETSRTASARARTSTSASAELAAVAALKGELPTPQEYLDAMKTIDPTAADGVPLPQLRPAARVHRGRGLRPRCRGGGRGQGHRGLEFVVSPGGSPGSSNARLGTCRTCSRHESWLMARAYSAPGGVRPVAEAA